MIEGRSVRGKTDIKIHKRRGLVFAYFLSWVSLLRVTIDLPRQSERKRLQSTICLLQLTGFEFNSKTFKINSDRKV